MPSTSIEKKNEEYEKKKYKHNKISYLILSFNSGLSHLSDLAINYYFKDTFHIEPDFYSKILAIIHLPHILKPLFGLFSDIFPIFGYKRKIYILIVGYVSTILLLLLSYLKINFIKSIIFLTLIDLCISFSTVLSQAIFIELGKNNLDKDKELLSMFYILKNCGLILSSYLKGYLIEKFSIKTVFGIHGFLEILIIISGFILIEEKIGNKNFNENKNLNESENKKLNKNNNNNNNKNKANIYDLINFIKKNEFILPFLFVIFFSSVPLYNETMFYYSSNVLKLTPNNFGIIYAVQNVLNLILILNYKKYFKNTSFKFKIFFSRLLLFIFLIPNYFLVKNVTKNYIDNFYVVLFTNSSVFILTTLCNLPVFNLAAVLCPKNLEGTIFAFFMAGLNLGKFFSNFLSSSLTSYFNIKNNNFENMHKLVITANFLLFVPLILLLFIPDYYFNKKETKNDNKKIN